jgi:DNA-directed RNA polymerase specialized sigma24 family protein
VIDAEHRQRLASAIAALPGRLRRPLELWHSGRYSYDEMAQIAGLAAGTVKFRVWEARQRVAQALALSGRCPALHNRDPSIRSASSASQNRLRASSL